MGSYFPDRGLNPCTLHWKHRVLTTGPPGKSQETSFYKTQSVIHSPARWQGITILQPTKNLMTFLHKSSIVSCFTYSYRVLTPHFLSSSMHLFLYALKEMGIPDHLVCLLRNLYAGQEATVRTGRGTTDWFQIGKGVCQGCILSPCLFNFYAEYIMRNAGLEEA